MTTDQSDDLYDDEKKEEAGAMGNKLTLPGGADAAGVVPLQTQASVLPIGEVNKVDLLVFQRALSKNRNRLCVMQFMVYFVGLAEFLKRSKKVVEVHSQFYEEGGEKKDQDLTEDEWRKKYGPPRKLPSLERYKQEFFPVCDVMGEDELVAREQEIRWFRKQSHTYEQLADVIHPFIIEKSGIFDEFFGLLNASDIVQGNTELMTKQFEQTKYRLGVTGMAVCKLFHVIRCNQRTLSWKQLYEYVQFVVKCSKAVQEAIWRHPNGEEANIGFEDFKKELDIQSDDAARWLFNSVCNGFSMKISWQAIRAHLQKLIRTRQEVKDFFEDKKTEREYEENPGEMLQSIQKAVDLVQTSVEEVAEQSKEGPAPTVADPSALASQLSGGSAAPAPTSGAASGIDPMRLHQLEGAMNGVGSDVKGLSSKLRGVKSEVTEVKSEINELRSELGEMKKLLLQLGEEFRRVP